MQTLPTILYPDLEKPKLAKLDALFQEWHSCYLRNAEGLKKHKADDMVCDGFYPNYFQQKIRILFIGREALEISGYNYIDMLYRAYREGKWIGNQHLNTSKFHSRMLKIAHGLLNDAPEWENIPSASQIGDELGSTGGVSFAFMNFSKFSNESGHWQCDWGVLEAAHQIAVAGGNFVQNEIAILEPHVIISMNLEDKTECLGKFTPVYTEGPVHSFWLQIGEHRALFLDSYHFANTFKNSKRDFYQPICEALKRVSILNAS